MNLNVIFKAQGIVLIINGLGSKGISQAPYWSDKLFNYIERNKQIDKEININRFKT